MDDDRVKARTGASFDEVLAFESATRDLVGLALRSVDSLDISLPQFRLLLALHELGPSSSVACARALGIVGSSVTRLADRLHTSGHLVRSIDSTNRSVVTLQLTDAGRRSVAHVVDRRRHELSMALDSLDAQQRATCADALRRLHEVLDTGDSDHESRRHLPL
ncbi:MarR family transcriptional regulator [Gordonia sp. HY442]|uniref:MarR family winged helix-turn-helix transcriptional regulator n=1 Tax=Gordonia zhenghanii TaxID=2911516 RepID=UPI001F025D21|nr:MarR family transcriptional regulator [Gordonia zhenghanii]MCF8601949.1 MarR family transcriptional regulator [Gordonia zhenghanii]MCF8602017.1 MarR family transcriptional regulator [Gordonia zhenghanii]